MKKWNMPTLTIVPAQLLTTLIQAKARSITCEKCHVR